MGVKIAASAVLGLIGLVLVIVGVGYLAGALALALTPALGAAGAAALTGGVFVGPPLLWAVIILSLRPKPKPKPEPVMTTGLWTLLFGAIARETPWIAVVGAGLVAAAEIFLRSRKSK